MVVWANKRVIGELESLETGDWFRLSRSHKVFQVWLTIRTPGYKNVRPQAKWPALEFSHKRLVWVVFRSCQTHNTQ